MYGLKKYLLLGSCMLIGIAFYNKHEYISQQLGAYVSRQVEQKFGSQPLASSYKNKSAA